MTETMVQFQTRRRDELRKWPRDRATGTPTNGVGSRGNTAHLNLKRDAK
jgi:hypothetical protein